MGRQSRQPRRLQHGRWVVVVVVVQLADSKAKLGMDVSRKWKELLVLLVLWIGSWRPKRSLYGQRGPATARFPKLRPPHAHSAQARSTMQHHAGIASGPEKFEGDDTASGSILAQLRERSMVLRLSYSIIGGAAQELEPLRDSKVTLTSLSGGGARRRRSRHHRLRVRRAAVQQCDKISGAGKWDVIDTTYRKLLQ
jgi:hypothetical protein